jgi:hypothetical protein
MAKAEQKVNSRKVRAYTKIVQTGLRLAPLAL